MNALTFVGITIFIIGAIGGVFVLQESPEISTGIQMILCFVAVIGGGCLIPLSIAFDSVGKKLESKQRDLGDVDHE